MDNRRVLELLLGSLEGIQIGWMPLDSINALFHKPEGKPCP
jgi:homospermidine synthase